MSKPAPWERQAGESEKAYILFCNYRDQGPYRGLDKCVKEMGKGPSLIYRLSAMHKWRERALAWGDELDKRKREAQIKEIQEMAKRHINQSMIFQRVLVMPAEAMIKRLNNDADGKVKNFNGITTDKLFDKVLKSAQTFGMVADVERKSRGEPTDISKQNIDHTSGGEKIHVILPPISQQGNISENNQEGDVIEMDALEEIE